ncbi:MAG: hypothetical protein D6748_09700 [Calditrichaeota bacterium]|nr:MAG: hypothetical protein D6748_09700 [Calditrichota bacterium]
MVQLVFKEVLYKIVTPTFRSFIRWKYHLLASGIIILSFLTIKWVVINWVEENYRESVDNTALLLAKQVKNAIITNKFDLTHLNRYNRNSTRELLKRFCNSDSRIQSIYLIDPEHRIVVSTDPKQEDKAYKDKDEIARLSTLENKILNRIIDDIHNIETLDVLIPLIVNSEFKGHLRARITNDKYYHHQQQKKQISTITYLLMFFSLGLFLVIARHFRGNAEASISRESSENAPDRSPHQEDVVEKKTSSNVFTDLTKLYQKAEELGRSYHESEGKISSMLRVLNQGLLIIDLDMNILTYNEYLLDIFRVRTSSSAHRGVYEVLQKNPRLVEIYRRAKDPYITEVKKHLKLEVLKGKPIWAEVTAKPFQNGEHVLGVAFYIKNTQVLSELEQSLQRSMTYGVISQLASSIAHEIRNPLSSLALHTAIVERLVNKNVEDEEEVQKIKKSLDILNAEVERLQNLIDQFFNLAKSKKFGLTYEHINKLMDEVLNLVMQQAHEKNIHVTYDFANNLPMVKISKDQLKQVILNLILNSFDAMPEGGELNLRTYFQEGYVVISVKDNGHGIPLDLQDSIFELYFTTKESGGGIGLAISRKIVEAHRGRIYFESEPESGTTFYVELPTSQN